MPNLRLMTLPRIHMSGTATSTTHSATEAGSACGTSAVAIVAKIIVKSHTPNRATVLGLVRQVTQGHSVVTPSRGAGWRRAKTGF